MYSKQSYNYGRHGSKRRLKSIPVIITLLVVILILGGIYFLLFNEKNKYEDYNTYNETNKQYGTVQHYEKENDDFYISLYYPILKEKNLNKIIKESYSTYLKSEKKKKDQKDILLTLKDCLHGKYGDLLNTLGVSEYDKESTSIKVDQNSFTYFTDQKLKNKITINYKENKDYIKLANKNIPSNAPLDVKAPKLMKVDPKKKMVAITLDDGPHKTLTERAMNAFEKYNGRGTFFELGQNMNLYPDIVKSVYERGHEVASHTYQHAQLTKLDATALDEEIKKTQEACFKACGTEPTLIRPPYGAKNDTVKSAFYSYGLSMILWDGDTEDWRYSKVTNGAQIVCDNIIRDAKSKTGDGNIVLIHDIHENSVAGLEMALDQLSKEGYQFVTVSDLLKYKGHSEYK